MESWQLVFVTKFVWIYAIISTQWCFLASNPFFRFKTNNSVYLKKYTWYSCLMLIWYLIICQSLIKIDSFKKWTCAIRLHLGCTRMQWRRRGLVSTNNVTSNIKLNFLKSYHLCRSWTWNYAVKIHFDGLKNTPMFTNTFLQHLIIMT